MRKKINGIVYDTATAQGLAVMSALPYVDHFEYWEETLYKTPDGHYFVAGWGGPFTHYGRPAQGGVGGGEDLRPLEPWQVPLWFEHYPWEPDEIRLRKLVK